MRTIYLISIIIVIISLLLGLYFNSLHRPGPTGLGFHTTADQAVRPGVRLDGKNIIITGGHSGIGIPTVETIAKLGPSVWMVARPGDGMRRCMEVASGIKERTGNGRIFCEEMDLGNLDSIYNFCVNWKKMELPLHVLINNAAMGMGPYIETEEGYDAMWATNHLGPFLLTNLLLENLKLGKPSRVVVVSSDTHRLSEITWDDISGKNTWQNGTSWKAQLYGTYKAYAQSKTANVLFSVKLNEIMKEFGNSNAVHPGLIHTGLTRRTNENDFMLYVNSLIHFFMGKTVSEGAATQIYVATAPELEGVGGLYFSDCNVVKAEDYATDPILAERLWKLSKETLSKYFK